MGRRNGKHVLMNAASVRDLTELTAMVNSTDSAHILLTAALQEALHNLQQMGYNACRITDSFPFSSERHKTARNHKSMSSHQKHLIDGYFELSLISILLFNLAELFFFLLFDPMFKYHSSEPKEARMLSPNTRQYQTYLPYHSLSKIFLRE